MENKNVKIEETKDFPFFKIISRNLLLIIIITIIGLLAGTGLAYMRSKPTYTASIRVMFVAKYSVSTETAGNDMLLAKIYLPNAVDNIKSPLFVDSANEKYQGEGKISSGAISSAYTGDSLIFTLSYTDSTPELAEAKLQVVIDSASENLARPEVTVAKDASLERVENRVTTKMNVSSYKYALIGAVTGCILAISYVLIKNSLDNTMKDKDELEKITGSILLATIEDIEVVDKRREHKKKTK